MPKSKSITYVADMTIDPFQAARFTYELAEVAYTLVQERRGMSGAVGEWLRAVASTEIPTKIRAIPTISSDMLRNLVGAREVSDFVDVGSACWCKLLRAIKGPRPDNGDAIPAGLFEPAENRTVPLIDYAPAANIELGAVVRLHLLFGGSLRQQTSILPLAGTSCRLTSTIGVLIITADKDGNTLKGHFESNNIICRAVRTHNEVAAFLSAEREYVPQLRMNLNPVEILDQLIDQDGFQEVENMFAQSYPWGRSKISETTREKLAKLIIVIAIAVKISLERSMETVHYAIVEDLFRISEIANEFEELDYDAADDWSNWRHMLRKLLPVTRRLTGLQLTGGQVAPETIINEHLESILRGRVLVTLLHMLLNVVLRMPGVAIWAEQLEMAATQNIPFGSHVQNVRDSIYREVVHVEEKQQTVMIKAQNQQIPGHRPATSCLMTVG